MARHDDHPAQEAPPGDELYALPLPQFTAARNALATTLKREGRTEEAERVRNLPRPSLSAWTVNQLYWRERTLFEDLLTAGERFREAQQAQLAGTATDLVAALDARRDAVAALTRAAARVLHEAGHNPTPDMMRRVTTTLEALATYGRSPNAPRPGRLMADVPPPGFEALAALVPRVGSSTVAGHGSRRVLTFGERPQETTARRGTKEAEAQRFRDLQARRAQAAADITRAERELRHAKAAAAKARDAMKTAATRATGLERTAATLTAQAEKAAAAADDARRRARSAAADAETAVQALQDAELTLTRAKERADTIE